MGLWALGFRASEIRGLGSRAEGCRGSGFKGVELGISSFWALGFSASGFKCLGPIGFKASGV